ncbi:hypothetical protein KJ657_01230 [Patescibacteria group bacterium]|nr:hypothetical protein [Patescibacteria group bacterium]MBU1015690.1 hypothetical protein [Patescibacteria group bacterium]MBU1685368.1 hypothetical protein [Patescibacteria group bacterium]MBU1938402.1 hypothetical protein [Patescibacteria group bacterium]
MAVARSPKDSNKPGKTNESPSFLDLLGKVDHIPGVLKKEDAEKKLPPETIGKLDGLVKLLTETLKKGDLSSLIGGIIAILTGNYGTPKEKAELAKAGQEVKEDAAKKEAQGKLGKLQADVDKDKKKKPELVKNPELGDGREYVLIGDSAAKGMFMSYEKGKQPSFIGEVGFSTFQVLERLKNEKAKLKGKKKAVIYCARNNIFGTSTDKLVDHMIEMAKICSDAGIPEVIVNSQFPPISNHVKDVGPKKFAELKRRNSELSEGLLKAYKDGRFPAGTRVVDLLAAFSDEKCEMKPEFVDPKATDHLHPWFAYKAGLNYMMPNESKAV